MAVTFLSRATLGLIPPADSIKLREGKIRGIVVHWIADAPEPEHPSVTWKRLQQEAMSGQNVNKTFYSDIEYNQGACESIAHPGNGTLLAGRDNKYEGAHATSRNGVANSTLLGIAVLGNVLNAAVIEALNLYIFLAVLVADHSVPFVLEGHRDLATVGGIATACPGDELHNWVTQTRTQHGFATL